MSDDAEELAQLAQQREELIEELIGRRETVDRETNGLWAELEKEKQAKKAEIVHDLYSLEKAIQENRAVVRSFPEVITLNVGGVLHTTTVDTLRREPGSMLDTMFSGRHRVSTDRNGHFFIDRDGEIFGHILGFLRTGLLPEDLSNMTIRRLKVEAEFYGLDRLLKHLEGGVRKSKPQFAVLSYTAGFVPSNFLGENPEGVELVFFQDDCYRSCKDMTEVLTNMRERGWSLVLNVPPTGTNNSKGRLIFSREDYLHSAPTFADGDPSR